MTTLISKGNGGDSVFSSLLPWPLGRGDRGNGGRLLQPHERLLSEENPSETSLQDRNGRLRPVF